MAALTVAQASLAGLVPTAVAAGAGGDTFPNDGKTALEVINGSGSSINVTVKSFAPASPGLAQTDNVVAVAAGVTKIIGPFPQAAFTDSTGNAEVSYSAVTTVTVLPIKIG